MIYKSTLHRNRCYNCDNWTYLLVSVKKHIILPTTCFLQCCKCKRSLGVTIIELDAEFEVLGDKEVNKVLYEV